MQIFIAAREVLHSNEQSHNLMAVFVFCVCSPPHHTLGKKECMSVYFYRQAFPNKFLVIMVMTCMFSYLRNRHWELAKKTCWWTTHGSWFPMSPSETQQENDKFSGGQDNGSWTMLVFAVLWKFNIYLTPFSHCIQSSRRKKFDFVLSLDSSCCEVHVHWTWE